MQNAEIRIEYTDEISVEDYTMLRASAGWPEIPREQAETGLRGSAFLVAAMDGDKAVGMTRLISDGGYMFGVADVAVLPEYRGRGIGSELISRAKQYIESTMRPGYKTYIFLTCPDERQGFYEASGFERCAGMFMRIITPQPPSSEGGNAEGMGGATPVPSPPL